MIYRRVSLPTQGQQYAIRKGLEVHTASEGRDPREAYDGSYPQWLRHIHGVAGEACFALAIGIREWRYKFNTFKKPDVAGYQVRATKYRTGWLPIRESDEPCKGEEFALVLIELDPDDNRIVLAGTVCGNSITGRDAMRDNPDGSKNKWWDPDPPKGDPFWKVPQSALTNSIHLPHKVVVMASQARFLE